MSLTKLLLGFFVEEVRVGPDWMMLGLDSSYINSLFAEIGPKLAAAQVIDFAFNGVKCKESIPNLVFSDNDIIECVRNVDVSKSSAIQYLPTEI